MPPPPPLDRNDEDLGEEFALELPLDLEKVTFAFAFNRPVDGVEVDWPPGMKTLHFGMAFNPRPAPSPTAAPSTSASAASAAESVRDGATTPVASRNKKASGVERDGRAGAGAGAGWAKFLPPTLEEIVFGGHFNQPVVREQGDDWAGGLRVAGEGE